jgi:catechol 2,3-dioxygenase-like lactoylglutathione lyase family enzyme
MAHVCFTVSDLDRSLDFYINKLGLEPAFEFRREDGTKYGQYIHLGGRSFIELFQGELGERAEGQPFRHICLEVDDLQSTVEALEAEGVEVTGVKLGMDKSWQGWITDPDGNRIELHGYTDESKQAPYLE